MRSLLLLVAAVAAVGALGWWIRRRQRDVDPFDEREYREPPVFQLPDGPL